MILLSVCCYCCCGGGAETCGQCMERGLAAAGKYTVVMVTVGLGSGSAKKERAAAFPVFSLSLLRPSFSTFAPSSTSRPFLQNVQVKVGKRAKLVRQGTGSSGRRRSSRQSCTHSIIAAAAFSSSPSTHTNTPAVNQQQPVTLHDQIRGWSSREQQRHKKKIIIIWG